MPIVIHTLNEREQHLGKHNRSSLRLDALAVPAAILAVFAPALAQTGPDSQAPSKFEVYGFAMVDTGYDFKQSDPNWFDVMRPSKLPAFENQFGEDGRWYSGVRQSRLGVKGYIPSSWGEIKTIFEFELFGTGVDAGQTTFRLRHAWGEIGPIGAGQTWSPFMDPDVFPNSIEYWGPNGMVFFRNVQVRYTPWSKGDSHLMFAVERPGASSDQGVYADRIELQNVRPRFTMPDFSARYRWGGKRGHLQIAGIFRRMQWDDLDTDQFDLSGTATGWGVNVSSNVKFSRHVLRLQTVVGEGIENYMNDAPADIGIENNFSDARKPIIGKPLPILGLVGFLDLNWTDKVSSTIGYSRVDIDNTTGQAATSFKSGQYALANCLFYPAKGVVLGPEVQWGYRDNKENWHTKAYRVQFSAKYNFSFRTETN
jgi:hypothetical protein